MQDQRGAFSRRWTGVLAPPAFADQELTQRARMFHVVAVTTLLLVTVVLPIIILAQPDTLPRVLLSMGVVDALAMATLLLNRRGRTRLASWLYITVILGLLTFNATTAGGIRSPGVQAYFIFVMLAGLLLGERTGVLTGLACAALGLGLVLLESFGAVAPQPIYRAGALWLLTCLFIGVALLAMRLATVAVRESLARAEAELSERRVTQGQLQERIKEIRLLHEAAQLLRDSSQFDRTVLTKLVARIPAAWMHAEDCRARIAYQAFEVVSPRWRDSPWRQTATFNVGRERGVVEVVYLSEHPPADEGPFLVEERALIQSVAELLRSHIEQHAAEERRRGLEAQLRQSQKMEALGTLAGGIAHDFNNILTAIGGYSQLALTNAPEGPVRADLEEILVAYGRAKDLVKRILLFSRRQEVERAVIAIGSVVDEALRLLRSSLPPSIRIEQTVAPDVPRVSADATQIHQVVMNLGTNAGYAMKEAGGTLSVEVDTITIGDVETAPSADLAAGPHVRLTVRDTGSGMSPEILQRLFEPFFTTKGHAGTGLGLSVVHGIVRDHGGAITAESEVGTGTVFRIYLPAAVAEADRAAPAEPSIVKGAGQLVMYVDDDEAIALVMSRTLQRLGYRCAEFTDPRVALQEFRTAPRSFDAVVTDLQMATMSGLDLARELRKIRADIPVGVASGYTKGDAGSNADVTAWLHKPATLAEISDTLQTLLA